jgi:IS1 family transposase
MWSFTGKKVINDGYWLWHAIDHATHTVLAYHFGSIKYHIFKALKKIKPL